MASRAISWPCFLDATPQYKWDQQIGPQVGPETSPGAPSHFRALGRPTGRRTCAQGAAPHSCHTPLNHLAALPSGTEGRDRFSSHREGRGTKPGGPPPTPVGSFRCTPSPLPGVPCAACHRLPDPLGERPSGTEGRDRLPTHRRGRGMKPLGRQRTTHETSRCSPPPPLPLCGLPPPPRPSRRETEWD